MKRPEEQELLNAMAGGDRAAAEKIVEQTYVMIYASLFRLSGHDPDLAADLTQETYRRAWKHLSGFRGQSRFSTWLYKIAYTTFLNHVRRPCRVEPLDPRATELPETDLPHPEDRLSRSEKDRKLRNAVMRLPEDLRFTVTARFWAELSVREISHMEQVSSAAIRKRVRRALKMLRALFESEEDSA